MAASSHGSSLVATELGLAGSAPLTLDLPRAVNEEVAEIPGLGFLAPI